MLSVLASLTFFSFLSLLQLLLHSDDDEVHEWSFFFAPNERCSLLACTEKGNLKSGNVADQKGTIFRALYKRRKIIVGGCEIQRRKGGEAVSPLHFFFVGGSVLKWLLKFPRIGEGHRGGPSKVFPPCPRVRA